MKKYIAVATVLLSLLVGCKKSVGPDVLPLSGQKMTFRASLPVTKSHFNGTGPQLYWDSSDKLTVYGVNAYDVLTTPAHYKNAVSEVLSLGEIAADGISGTFTSVNAKTFWFPDPVNTMTEGKDTYFFFSYYPSGSEPKQILEEVVDNKNWQYLPFNIPEVQDGKSYSEYQIIYDPGLPVNEGGDYDPFLVSKTNILDNNGQVIINHLAPVTAMLKFTLRLPEGVTSKMMTSLKISLEGSEQHSIAGDTHLLLYYSSDGDSVPFCMDRPSGVEYLRPVDNQHGTITITPFSENLTDDPGDFFYVVLNPFRSQASDLKVKFTAQDEEGAFYICKTSVPSLGEYDHDEYFGFRGGSRYLKDVVLSPVEIDPDSANAGEYEDGGQNPFTEID